MNIKPGDVVFFKRAKKSTDKKCPEIAFEGHGFAVMLGHVPPFANDPPESHLLRLMGTIGFISFDDVREFFGADIGERSIRNFEKKYYPDAKVLPFAPHKSSPLVDASGKTYEPVDD